MNELLASDRDAERFDLPKTISVNGREISRQQVYREMQYHPASTPAAAMFNAARSLVLGELLGQRSRELGLCDGELQPGTEVFDTAVDELLEREVPVPAPGRPECLEYYSGNRDQFMSPSLAEVRHILLLMPVDDIDEQERTRQLADSMLQEISGSAEPLRRFAELAASHSKCSSKDSGGSLGQIGPGDTVAAFEEAVFAHGTGLIREPVVSDYGLHLIYVEQFDAGRPLSFDVVASEVAEHLETALRWRMTRAYLLELVSHAEITGIDLLSNIDLDHGGH